jgi:phthiocerol/phenolphthiocerol synthesis type-I polyketide synthase E
MMTNVPYNGNEIAIVGMAGRFPGARTLDAFWRNLRDGVESVTSFTDEELLAAGVPPEALGSPEYVKSGVVLEDIELFDAAFFGFTPREAEVMDPQQRLFLECAWQALEQAGYDSGAYGGAIGVFGGAGLNSYLLFNLYAQRDLVGAIGGFQAMLLNEKDHLATRVSYKLDLRGPSVTVQTACSTSLVAVHMACQSLLNAECDMALAGGVAISVPQRTGYWYQPGGVASPDGHCRAFDARAQGTVSGSGVGVVVLKRLEDALADGDTIHAVIKGSAINNDGAAKVGYTAPSVDGQAGVIAEALALAQVAPETIGYVEAHGTGTPLGDPIEIAALTRAFRAGTPLRNFCAIGSLKTNIGHLDAAAGVAGLIKAVLALRHGQIPPSLHFRSPNPKLDLAGSPFYVSAALTPWERQGGPRRAGVSSFGIGGTNVHVVLEEAPAMASSPSRPWQLLTISARSAAALEDATDELVEHLRCHPDLSLADVAYTLQVGRRAFNHRRSLACRDLEDALAALSSRDTARLRTRHQQLREPPIAFLFPGQGSQYAGMGADLYQAKPAFREQIDRCAEILQPHLGLDLREVLYPDLKIEDRRLRIEGTESSILNPLSSILDQTQYAQPALFVVEYALARMMIGLGVRPQAMIGHSIGEYVAACLAGVFSLEDALALVAARGRLMQQLPGGAMLAVMLSEQALQPYLGAGISLAAVNGPSLCVLAGAADGIEAVERRLADEGHRSRRLHTSHAFHSEAMDSIAPRFAELVGRARLAAPKIPYISNVTGAWITAEQATDPGYWAAHLRETVRFGAGAGVLASDPDRLYLELGPGQTLSTLMRQHLGAGGADAVLSTMRHPRDQRSDVAFLLDALGRLWLAGASVGWAMLHAHERRRRVPLPTYPFERRAYWIGPRQADSWHQAAPPPVAQALSLYLRPELPDGYEAPRNEIEATVVAIWQELLGIERIGVHDSFFELGGHSLLATQLATRLHEIFPVELSLPRLFEMPTVARLAELIEEKLIEQVEALDEDEVQRLV